MKTAGVIESLKTEDGSQKLDDYIITFIVHYSLFLIHYPCTFKS